MTDRLDSFSYVPGPDRPLWERVRYVKQKTIAELEIYADDIGMEHVQDLPQNVFTSALRHCCEMIFRPAIDRKADYFKIDTRDHELIFELAQVFIDICDRYNKICQVSGLAAYLGVSDVYLYNLAKYDNTRYTSENSFKRISANEIDDSNRFNVSNTDNASNNDIDYNASAEDSFTYQVSRLKAGCGSNVISELKKAKERQLQGLLIDGKGQLVGVIAILNHEYNYAKQDSYNEPVANLTSSERLQMLSEKYRVSSLPDKLSDN